MYYINLTMKNNLFKVIEYTYYFSLIFFFIIYLFPGSIIGYLLYGSLWQQPNLINNPFGTAINHLFFFSFITLLITIIRSKVKNILTSYKFILLTSFFLEIFHLVVPNRAFELYDLIANLVGVVLVLFINQFLKWQKYF